MSYAQISDMLSWVGEIDLVRLSVPRNAQDGTVNQDVVQAALDNSSAVIDSYLRKRYATPLGQAGEAVPQEIIRCCCILAQYELGCRDGRTPSETDTALQAGQMKFLRDISDGRVLLDITEAPSGDDSYAQVSTRCPVYGGCDSTTYGYGNGVFP